MYEYKAKPIRVIDADTFEFLLDLGFSVHTMATVRLAECDAWERFSIKGIHASQFVNDLFFADDTEIIVRTKKYEKGKYGRWIAAVDVVRKGQRLELKELLLERGYLKSSQ